MFTAAAAGPALAAAAAFLALAGCTSEVGGVGASAAPSALPPHFRIESVGSVQDCRLDADRVRCDTSLDPLPENYESWTGQMTGTLSGLTLEGTSSMREIYHPAGDPGCRVDHRRSGPVTYEFSLDGTVVMGEGQMDYETTQSGSCTGSFSGTQWGGQGTGLWSAVQ